MYNAIRKRFKEHQLETNPSVDEQIAQFEKQVNIKKFFPNKPKKW